MTGCFVFNNEKLKWSLYYISSTFPHIMSAIKEGCVAKDRAGICHNIDLNIRGIY